jgi:hypothetical protein
MRRSGQLTGRATSAPWSSMIGRPCSSVAIVPGGWSMYCYRSAGKFRGGAPTRISCPARNSYECPLELWNTSGAGGALFGVPRVVPLERGGVGHVAAHLNVSDFTSLMDDVEA